METRLKENKFWVRSILADRFYKQKMLTPEEYYSKVDKIAAEDIARIVKKYVDTRNYILLILKPAEINIK